MKDDIFTKVIETVRGNPAEYDIIVQNITGKILSQNNLKYAEILERFVNEWNHSKSSKDSIVIAWLLSDRFLGTGEPAVRKVFADRLLEKIDPEENRLNPERLQELIRGVIFSDEESIETLRNALIAIETVSKQIPKTTSGKQKTTPNDLITLLIVVEDYVVSRSTIKRRIKIGEICSYRKSNAAKNSPHLVSRAEIEQYYNKKR